MKKSPWPWLDRAGRFSWLKTVMLGLEMLPGAWVAYALVTGNLGARPVTEAIHETGTWAVRFLMLSLLATPARAIFNWQRLVLVRRQLGLTALFYTLAHVVLYTWDQKWNVQTVSAEILQRFYLQVGLVALVGLAVLGVTSTDKSLRALGQAWKRVHRLAYLAAGLSVLHFFLQAKADVAEATVIAGLLVWLLGWRLLPCGPDRQPLPILALGLGAAAATVGIEYAWFALATRIDPVRVIRAEADLSYGPHPAGQVLLLCLCLTMGTALFWASRREALRRSVWFGVALYGGGAAVVSAILFAFNLTEAWLPEAWPVWQAALAFVAGVGALGLARAASPGAGRVMDVVCGAMILLPLVAGLASYQAA